MFSFLQIVMSHTYLVAVKMALIAMESAYAHATLPSFTAYPREQKQKEWVAVVFTRQLREIKNET